MNDKFLHRLINGGSSTLEEGVWLWNEVPLGELISAADDLRREVLPDSKVVTWQIDRNVNITNVCTSGCKFCNFHCKPHQREQAYITTIEEYIQKIDETIRLGGDQLLLQGGLHPELGIEFYENLFRDLKSYAPTIRLNALGAPEVVHISKISNIGIEECLIRLCDAGLDTLPGAGAEILVDEVRRKISPAKPNAKEWIDVMLTAHKLNIPSTATMMYGHIETITQRIEHLLTLRAIQECRPAGHWGFTAFIPWICCTDGTELEKAGIVSRFSPLEYLRLIAVSRLILNNVRNIQASWLTVGVPTAQIALHAGANDMGSIMIEENVVSSAGAKNRLDADQMQSVICDAGFTPRLRDQLYQTRG